MRLQKVSRRMRMLVVSATRVNANREGKRPAMTAEVPDERLASILFPELIQEHDLSPCAVRSHCRPTTKSSLRMSAWLSAPAPRFRSGWLCSAHRSENTLRNFEGDAPSRGAQRGKQQGPQFEMRTQAMSRHLTVTHSAARACHVSRLAAIAPDKGAGRLSVDGTSSGEMVTRSEPPSGSRAGRL